MFKTIAGIRFQHAKRFYFITVRRYFKPLQYEARVETIDSDRKNRWCD